MAESYESDAIINALTAATDSLTGGAYPTIGESPHYTSLYKLLRQIQKAIGVTVSELQPYVDDGSTHDLGVRSGKIMQPDGDIVAFTGTTISLTNGSTNYAYIYDNAGTWTLAANIVGYPDQTGVPHIPIATISLGSSPAALLQAHITDDRGDVLFQPPGQFALIQNIVTHNGEVVVHNGEVVTI